MPEADLPDRTIAAAGPQWRTQITSRDTLSQANFQRWYFEISRLLLPAKALAKAWFYYPDGPPEFDDCDSCLVSNLGLPKALKKGKPPPRRGRRPSSCDAHVRRLARRPNNQPWLAGGVLRFRSSRWSFTPRKLGKQDLLDHQAKIDAERAKAETAASPAARQAILQDVEDLEDQLIFLRSPAVDVSRLLCFAENGPPPDEDRTYAVHYGCTDRNPQNRARCINKKHLCWGSAADNAYHAAEHKQKNSPAQHRPAHYVPPSQEPDYVQPKRLRYMGHW